MTKANDTKFKEIIRALKFTLISISAGIIQIGLFTVLNLTLGKVIKSNFWHYISCSLPALVASVLWNFTINRKITFKSTANIKRAMLLVFLFYAVFTPVTTVLGGVAADNIKMNATALNFIIQAVTMILNFVLEFLYTRFIVYRNTCDTAVGKKETAQAVDGDENATPETNEQTQSENEVVESEQKSE